MKSKIVKKFGLLILLFLILCGIWAGLSVQPARADDDEDVKFAIHSGEICVTVDENKNLRVEENLRVAFLQKVKSFSRAVTGKNKSYFNVNGTPIKGRSYLTRISGLTAEIDGKLAETELSVRNGAYHHFTVKNPDGYFGVWENGSNEGFYNIRISYLADYSDDADGKASFYFVPFINYYSTWLYFDGDKQNVSKVKVNVTLPASFGEKDAVLLNGVKKVGGLTASGNSLAFEVPVKGSGGYAVRVMLPAGTFKTSATYFSFYWWFVGAAAAVMLLGIILTLIFRARRPLAPVEYGPPILNPIQFSAFWHGYARRKDLSTLILRWASLGCIKIKKDGKKDLILTKIKELPEGRPVAEYGYFKELFVDGEYCSRRMRGKEYKERRGDIRYAATKLIDEFGEPVTHARGVETAKVMVMFSSLLTLIISFAYFIMIADDFAFALALIFVVGGLALVVGKTNTIISAGRESKTINKNNVYRITSLIVSVTIFPVALMFYFIVSSHYMPVYDYIQLTPISVAWIIICLYVLPRFIAKRTDEAQAMYGRMLGFKKFLKLAQVSEMETMLEENPDYYLDILPYCMIMGLSKKLDKKTEFLAAPEWADGFDAKHFASSLFYSVKRSVITRKKKVK